MTRREQITQLFNEHRQALADALYEMECNAQTLPESHWEALLGELVEGCRDVETLKTEIVLAACNVTIVKYLCQYVHTMVQQSAAVAEVVTLIKKPPNGAKK